MKIAWKVGVKVVVNVGVKVAWKVGVKIFVQVGVKVVVQVDVKISVQVGCNESTQSVFGQGWRQEFPDWGADSSDEGAKILLSGYFKCQKSPTN